MRTQPAGRPIRRVALSLRVSTESQVDGFLLQTQERSLRDWAASEGWEIAEVYTDAGRSAFRKVAGRHAFLRMLEDAEAGKFDAVLVQRGDRFMRGVGQATLVRDRLAAAEVQYRSLEEPGAWDGTPVGFLQGGLSDMFAEYYSLDLSLKKTKNLRTRADSGLTLGDVPFGYTRTDPKQPIQPAPSESVAVRHIFERYTTGLISMDELAEDLNDRGHQPRSKRGKLRFSKASVQGMLTNPVYAGFVALHGEIIGDGRHEAIITPELFEHVQRVIAQRARRPRTYARRPPHPYLLAGVAHCESCAGPLWANPAGGGRYHYYRCAADRRGEICADANTSTRAEHPEGQLGRLFGAMNLPPEWQDRIRELSNATGDPNVTAEQMEYWRGQVKRARDGFRAGLLEVREAAVMKDEAEAHLRELEAQHTPDAITTGPIFTDMCTAWPHLTAEERRDAVRIMFDAVAVDVRTGQITQVLPKGSFEPLFRAVATSEGGAVGFCDWRPRADSR